MALADPDLRPSRTGLPVAGVTGTLAERFDAADAAGRPRGGPRQDRHDPRA
jgi:D-alanyl-D-alanine carboxypeptidase